MINQISAELGQVKRPGMDELMKFLVSSDYFSAPASRGHHLNVPGGLAVHHWGVFRGFLDIYRSICPDVGMDAIRVCALTHDLCKVNFFKITKDAFLANSRPEITIVDQEPLGHGEKSVIVLQRYIKLTTDEALAIRWHMGAWDAAGDTARRCLNLALDRCALLRGLMLADQMATFKESH